MEAYAKDTLDPYDLLVISSADESAPYFLRNCLTVGFQHQLDFRWVKKGRIKASLTLALNAQGEAISLPQAPFGGVWLEDNLSSAALEGFIRSVLAELKQRGFHLIRITQPPKPYEQHAELINYLLFKLGFEQETILSHQFYLGKKKIKKLVQKDSAKFLSKSKELGLKIKVGAIQNFSFLQEIKTWNRARGYDILFDDGRLIAQVSEYPERYFLISILKDGNALAHTLAVKLLPDSIYYFLSVTQPRSSIKNLGELCLFQLFQLAAEQKLNFVDLGSSDSNQGINHNLIFFKSRFSNDISNKVTWTLKLS